MSERSVSELENDLRHKMHTFYEKENPAKYTSSGKLLVDEIIAILKEAGNPAHKGTQNEFTLYVNTAISVITGKIQYAKSPLPDQANPLPTLTEYSKKVLANPELKSIDDHFKKDVVNACTYAFDALLSPAGGLIGPFGSKVATAISGTITASKVANAAYHAAPALLESSKHKSFWGKTKDYLGEVWESAKTKMSDSWNAFKTSAKNNWNKFTSYAKVNPLGAVFVGVGVIALTGLAVASAAAAILAAPIIGVIAAIAGAAYAIGRIAYDGYQRYKATEKLHDRINRFAIAMDLAPAVNNDAHSNEDIQASLNQSRDVTTLQHPLHKQDIGLSDHDEDNADLHAVLADKRKYYLPPETEPSPNSEEPSAPKPPHP